MHVCVCAYVCVLIMSGFPLPCRNQTEIARILLAAGADINSRNINNNTPLMICGAVGNYKLLKIFTEYEKLDLHAQVKMFNNSFLKREQQ